jgi:hypothetical protein
VFERVASLFCTKKSSRQRQFEGVPGQAVYLVRTRVLESAESLECPDGEGTIQNSDQEVEEL